MKNWMIAACSVAALAGAAMGQSVGADVVHQDIQDVVNYTPVNGVRAYSLGSYTCNLGNTTLIWVSNGSPGLGMNAFRIHNGRMQQIGLGFAKSACCAASGTGCNMTCNSAAPGSGLKPGCRDIYSGSWNGQQGRLAPRSSFNAWTGAETFNGATGTFNTIDRRLQVAQSDLTAANFPGAQYFVEGVYVGTDDAAAGNSGNNATYKRVTVDASFNLLPVANTQQVGSPAILAWRAHGNGQNVVDPRVDVGPVTVPGEGRFYVANKVTSLGNGQWLYDYAIYNLNSDRSAGSFELPVPAGITLTGIGFSDVNYHSGEVYDNTDWTMTRTANSVVWSSPQTYAQNPNSNAIRWGTMYNFWFTSNVPPRASSGTIGIFKPATATSTATSINTSLRVPGCPADLDQNGVIDGNDVIAFFHEWDAGSIGADFNADGGVDGDDVIGFFNAWDSGC